jgi:hypothetical protein
VGLGRRGRERMMRPSDQATEQGSVGKGLKKDGKVAGGERDSYRRLKAAAGPCAHLPRSGGRYSRGGKPTY